MAIVEADVRDVRAMARRLRRMSDGKELRKLLTAKLREVGEPAASKAASNIRGLPHRSTAKSVGGSLGRRVAKQVRIKVATSGKSAGVRISVAKRSGLPRGFVNAPQRLNRAGGWRHRVYGRNVWVSQIGLPGWFDDPMREANRPAREACAGVLGWFADEIARRG